MAQSKYWKVAGGITPEELSEIQAIFKKEIEEEDKQRLIVTKSKGVRATKLKKMFNTEDVLKCKEQDILESSLPCTHGEYTATRKRKAETDQRNRSKKIAKQVDIAMDMSDDEYYDYCKETNDGENLLDYKVTLQLRNMEKQKNIRRILKEEAANIVWKPWQQEVIKVINQTGTDRLIHVVLDPKGGVGKSYLCRNYSILHREKILEMSSGKKADMLYLASQKCGYDTVFLDLCRGDYKEVNGISYTGIEALKNGSFVSTKYESKYIVGLPPHMVIFTNKPLDYDQLSGDRWRIMFVKEDESIINFKPKEYPMCLDISIDEMYNMFNNE